VGRILSALHPETEELGALASHMVVRLLNAGHDDVAYNLVQFLVENSAEESSRLVSAEFLEQLVRTNATVTKLLWFLKVNNSIVVNIPCCLHLSFQIGFIQQIFLQCFGSESALDPQFD
jgi:6-phosphogluconate dehydrogenase (decarboxylating)